MKWEDDNSVMDLEGGGRAEGIILVFVRATWENHQKITSLR
jgi:hypothetical protein